MGYRSEVVLCVALHSAADADKLMAIYRLDPRVAKHNLEADWDRRTAPDGIVYFLYHAASVKWYPAYEDVLGMEHMFEIARLLGGDPNEDNALRFATIKAVIGEEEDDVFRETNGNDDELEQFLYDNIGIRRTMEVNI